MGLGEADADSRWIGIRRHQAALIILGVGITGDWIIASHAQSAELALGLCVLVAALPTIDGLTIAELLCVTTLFALRSSWMIVQAESRGQTLAIRARGATTVTGFELVHRGRLDLSGTALELSARLVALMKSLATGGETDHVSIHVRSSAASAQTLLTLRTNVAAPEGWREDSQLLRHFLDLRSGTDSAGLLERWSSARSECATSIAPPMRERYSRRSSKALATLGSLFILMCWRARRPNESLREPCTEWVATARRRRPRDLGEAQDPNNRCADSPSEKNSSRAAKR